MVKIKGSGFGILNLFLVASFLLFGVLLLLIYFYFVPFYNLVFCSVRPNSRHSFVVRLGRRPYCRSAPPCHRHVFPDSVQVRFYPCRLGPRDMSSDPPFSFPLSSSKIKFSNLKNSIFVRSEENAEFSQNFFNLYTFDLLENRISF